MTRLAGVAVRDFLAGKRYVVDSEHARSYQDDRRMSSIPDLFTVGLVAEYVAWKLRRCASTDGNHRVVSPTSCEPASIDA
jgi:hypothetical protein